MSGVAKRFAKGGAVGPSAGDVAGLDGDLADLRFFLQSVFEGANEVEDGDWVAVADVVDSGGGGGDAGLAAVPVGERPGVDGRSRAPLLRRRRRCR